MAERKDIGLRLENWARWCVSARGKPAASMTGAICEAMRKASLGNVWSGHEIRNEIDDSDAIKIEVAMRKIDFKQRLLLNWCYIEQAQPNVVCRKMSIPLRPASVFVDLFREAQEAIEDQLDNEGNS